MPKLARVSFSRDPYECAKPWPEDCFVQAGKNGIVFRNGSLDEVLQNPEKGLETVAAVVGAIPDPPASYRTAFFEAFPRSPDTFIRGEGKDIQEAEAKAWAKYSKHVACPGHEFEKRGYKNGGGFCKHCNMFSSKAFEPDLRKDTPEEHSYLEVALEASNHGDTTWINEWLSRLDKSKDPVVQLEATAEYKNYGLDMSMVGLAISMIMDYQREKNWGTYLYVYGKEDEDEEGDSGSKRLCDLLIEYFGLPKPPAPTGRAK